MIKLIKLVLMLMLVVFMLIGVLLFMMQQKPNWMIDGGDTTLNDRISEALSGDSIKKLIGSNIGLFLSTGDISLNSSELSALTYGALASDQQGLKVLQLSDDVQAKILEKDVEAGVLISTSHLGELINDEMRAKQINGFMEALPFLKDKRVYLAIRGKPYAVDGDLGIDQNLDVVVGSVSVPLSWLLALSGEDSVNLNQLKLDIKYVKVNGVKFKNNELILDVKPEF